MKRLKKILIVDDVDLAHNIYRVRLDSMNVSILSAKSGSEAIAMISREDDIDLIILDLNMSSMNGLEVLNMLPVRTRQKIPVIVVSSEQDKSKQQTALQRGAVAFFDKSRIKELKRFIDHLFSSPEHINCALAVCSVNGEAGMRK